MARTLDQITQYKIRGVEKRVTGHFTLGFGGFLLSENGFVEPNFYWKQCWVDARKPPLGRRYNFHLAFMYFLVFLGGCASQKSHAKKGENVVWKLDQKNHRRFGFLIHFNVKQQFLDEKYTPRFKLENLKNLSVLSFCLDKESDWRHSLHYFLCPDYRATLVFIRFLFNEIQIPFESDKYSITVMNV